MKDPRALLDNNLITKFAFSFASTLQHLPSQVSIVGQLDYTLAPKLAPWCSLCAQAGIQTMCTSQPLSLLPGPFFLIMQGEQFVLT